MKSLLLLLGLIPALHADKFVLHVGFHSDAGAVAYSAAKTATGNSGVNINCDAQDAHKAFAVGGLALVLVWIIYKLNQIEDNQHAKK